MSLGNPWLHVAIVAIGIVFALGLVSVGIVRLVRQGLTLKSRIARYADLPIVAVVAKTGITLGAANARVAQIPELQARIERAQVALQTARGSIVRDLLDVDNVARLIGAIVLG